MIPADLAEQLAESVSYIKSHCDQRPRIGIILGSGMGPFAESIEQKWSCDYAEIPHFGTTSVEGHPGRLIMGSVAGIPVAALQGRLHLYEGYTTTQVVHPTRTLAMLGIEVLLVTNAAGGLSRKSKPGSFMAITDHINLMGDNPLRGGNLDQFGPRFPDMTEAYDKSLVRLSLRCGKNAGLRIFSGVYIGLPGPTYETPAEVRFLRTIGGDAVGMSTVPEVIAANHLGVRVCGVSCITNYAAGISKTKLSHSEVSRMARVVEEKFKLYISALVQCIGEFLDGSHSKSS